MSDQREKILACACDLYLTGGLEGFSMRKLAKQVGVTAPALYRHYDGRDAVLGDVLREAYQTFTRYIYRALGAPTPLERFSKAGEGYLEFVFDHPRWYGILFSGPDSLGMEQLPGDIEEMGCAVHQFWIDRVRECMDAGILKQGDPAASSVTMWAHAHGMVQLYHHGHFRMTPDEFKAVFQASFGRLMAGVATEAFTAEMEALCEEATVEEQAGNAA